MVTGTTSRSCDHVSGAHIYQILASTTHGVDIYERVFNSLFGASVVGLPKRVSSSYGPRITLFFFLDTQNIKLY